MGCFVDRFLWRRAVMVSRRPSLAAIAAAIVILSATLFAQPAPQQQQRKLSDAEKKEIQTILKIVDDVAAGQPAPNDLSVSWAGSDLLKAQNNKEYLPYTVTLDRSKVNGGKVEMYWRVVAKNAPAPTATDGKKDE